MITIPRFDNSDVEKGLASSGSDESMISGLDAYSDESLPPQLAPVIEIKNGSHIHNECAVDKQHEQKVDPLDIPPRPHSEPLFSAPATVLLRPSSAEPSLETHHPIKVTE